MYIPVVYGYHSDNDKWCHSNNDKWCHSNNDKWCHSNNDKVILGQLFDKHMYTSCATVS